MPTYEYHLLIFNTEGLLENAGGDVSEQLTELGRHGWDIAATFNVADQDRYVLILQRPTE